MKTYTCDVCHKHLKTGEVFTVRHSKAVLHLCPDHERAFMISLNLLRLGDDYMEEIQRLHAKYFKVTNG